MHEGAKPARVRAIEDEGAEVHLVDGTYDDSVRANIPAAVIGETLARRVKAGLQSARRFRRIVTAFAFNNIVNCNGRLQGVRGTTRSHVGHQPASLRSPLCGGMQLEGADDGWTSTNSFDPDR
jgi:hypothetical protein